MGGSIASTTVSLPLLLPLLELLLLLLLLELLFLDDKPLTIFSILFSSLALGLVLTGLRDRLLQPLLLDPVGEMLPIGELFDGGASRAGDVLGLTVSNAEPMRLVPKCDDEEEEE